MAFDPAHCDQVFGFRLFKAVTDGGNKKGISFGFLGGGGHGNRVFAVREHHHCTVPWKGTDFPQACSKSSEFSNVV